MDTKYDLRPGDTVVGIFDGHIAVSHDGNLARVDKASGQRFEDGFPGFRHRPLKGLVGDYLMDWQLFAGYGFSLGDEIFQKYRDAFLVNVERGVEVVHPDRAERFLVTPEGSKIKGHQVSGNMKVEDQIRAAKNYIDWVSIMKFEHRGRRR